MKLLLDMNLPPRWVNFLSGQGIECFHWSDVGEYTAEVALRMNIFCFPFCGVATHTLCKLNP